MRGVRDEAAAGVEDRAREVEPLLDVDGVRGRPQPLPHLLGHRHEQASEHSEQPGSAPVGAVRRIRARRPAGAGAGRAAARVSSRSRPGRTAARQPASTTVVARPRR